MRHDYMRQHCVSTLSHPDLVTDGYALGITLLMCLTGQPAVGLRDECRFILKFPDQRSKWKSTAALSRAPQHHDQPRQRRIEFFYVITALA